MNCVLTNAQIELIASDVSVVDYDYKKDKPKKKKGEFDNTKADSRQVKQANEQWLKEHGDGDNAGWVSLNNILGNGLKQDIGVNIE